VIERVVSDAEARFTAARRAELGFDGVMDGQLMSDVAIASIPGDAVASRAGRRLPTLQHH